MGTEFLVAFVPAPVLFWIWNIAQLRNPDVRGKAAILLVLGIGFMVFFALWAGPRYFLQGVVIGSFFYAPFYLVCWLLITGVQRLARGSPNAAASKSN